MIALKEGVLGCDRSLMTPKQFDQGQHYEEK